MPIQHENMENFYRGTCAEYLVASRAYFHGFEAHKFSPDFGVDLLVTNKARQIFLHEEEIEFSIQIKSSLFTKNVSYISIDDRDLELLLEQKNPILIICIFEGEFIGEPSLSFDMNSYEQEMHSQDQWLDNGWASTLYHSQFDEPRWRDKDAYLKNREAANNLGLDGFNYQLFWFNKNQIVRAKELGVLQVGKKSNWFIKACKTEDGVWYFDSNNDTEYFPYTELSYLSYLFLNKRHYGLDMADFAQPF